MMKEAIAVFDIGKTNKKVLLYNKELKPFYVFEQNFQEIVDEDGVSCDDVNRIHAWIIDTLKELSAREGIAVKGVNFSTYGATLMYLDQQGKPLTPLYNYLKPMPAGVAEAVYEQFGGVEEFSRCSASPALGFLNSGLQILWLKKTRPEVFSKVSAILHFPQFCSYLLSGQAVSEYTSIGCHTAMWDFDRMVYHQWLEEEGIFLPAPVSNDTVFPSKIDGLDFLVGTGIHDSSSSLVPYLMQTREKFIILSTGTWCINMNPFNEEPLTSEQLRNDCLSYMSISQQPVKSSRLFMGHIHDVNVARLAGYYNVDTGAYKKITADDVMIRELEGGHNRFFSHGVPDGYVDKSTDLSLFTGFDQAYHRLMMDLTNLCVRSIGFIIPKRDDIQKVFISGGFSRNAIFLRYLSQKMPGKKVYSSEIDNASALGAAMMVHGKAGMGPMPVIDLQPVEVL